MANALSYSFPPSKDVVFSSEHNATIWICEKNICLQRVVVYNWNFFYAVKLHAGYCNVTELFDFNVFGSSVCNKTCSNSVYI